MSVQVDVRCDRCREKVPKSEWCRVRLGPETKKRNRRKAPLDLCENCLEELLLVPLGVVPADLPFGAGPAEGVARTEGQPCRPS